MGGPVLPQAVLLVVLLHSGAHAWDYSKHGQDWTDGMCQSRERQSPIDVPETALEASATGKLSYNYLEGLVDAFPLLNNGHTIAADVSGLGYGGITYENAYWNLMNVNFHSPSEHSYGGKKYAAEAHLVHKKSDSAYAVTK